MRFFIKILITLVVLAILLPFTLLKGKDGRPLMSLDKLKAPDISVPSLPASGRDGGNKDLIYRWTDSEGVIHFTNTPPPQGVEYTVKGYDPNTNLIQSVELPQDEEPSVRKPVQAATKKPPGSLQEIGNPYSVEKVEKLMEDAQNVQKLLEDRLKRQEEIIQSQ